MAKEYSKDIKHLVYLSSKMKNISMFKNPKYKHHNLYLSLVKETSFLDLDVSFRERLYYAENNIHEPVICIECNINHLHAPRGILLEFCSTKCSNSSKKTIKKRKETNLELYGDEVVARTEYSKNKSKETCLDKYGVEFHTQSDIVKDKSKETCLEKYGEEFFFQSDEFKNKSKETCLENYGVDNPMKSLEVKTKVKNTNIIRYGFKCSLLNEQIKEKRNITWNKNYGGHPIQSDIIKNKFIEEYGTNHPWANKQVIENIKIIKLNNYHTRFIKICNEIYDNKYTYLDLNHSHDEISIICPIHGEWKTIMYYHMNGTECPICKPTNKGFSQTAIEWLDYISKTENIYIQHAMNLNEYKIPDTNYKVDGYCKENNTIYEFLGDYWHGNPKIFLTEDIHPIIKISYGELYDKTFDRLKEIQSLGYNVVFIWENDYKNENK